MSLSKASKRRDYSNYLLYERGLLISNIYSKSDWIQERTQALKHQKEERAKKILKLIECFKEKFAENASLLQAMEKTFEVWQEHEYNKEIPYAMIQMESCMRISGFIKEWYEWKYFVKTEFEGALKKLCE